MSDTGELFDRLFEEHFHPLVCFFGRRGLDRSTCEDLAQDAMLRVYRGLEGFEGRAQVRTWVLEIAGNLWKNWVRDYRGTAKRTHEEQPLEQPGQGELEVSEGHGLWPRPSEDPERRLIEKQAREQIDATIRELPPRQRTCLELWLGGLSYEQIATREKISIQTVRSSVSRGRDTLLVEMGLTAAAPRTEDEP